MIDVNNDYGQLAILFF